MRPVRAFALTGLLVALAAPAIAQKQFVHWTATMQPASVRAGEHAQIVLTATVDAPYHMYSLKVVPNANIPTTIKLVPGSAAVADGPAVQPQAKVVRDTNFDNALLEYYESGVAFGLPVQVSAGSPGNRTAAAAIRYQVCKEGACERPVELNVPANFMVEAGPARPEFANPVTSVPAQPANYQKYSASPEPTVPGTTAGDSARQALQTPATDQTSLEIAEAKRKGILNFLLLSFGAGLAALLTPCVFPMIPITVSFFAKSNQDKSGRPDIRGASAYSIGIIGTFTGLGLLMTAIFGPAGINRLAQNPWTNLILAGLFVFLAANLFGAFEIILPTWLVDKAQERKGSGGWIGPMAMGFAFTLTSFTCTVAFVGTLLAAAAQGDWFYPAVGMLAFSTAFALPFFLLALFPQYLARLPKSGSWMISVKAFMGFLELAAALKFVSNIDLYLQRGLLTRSVFLAIWAGLAIVAGLYLWGWLRLTVDTSKRFGIPRRIIGALSIVTGIWCLAAINGAPLGTLAAFLPPEPYPYREGVRSSQADKWERSWEKALARAQAEHKPIFINFTGAQCTNCREMENNVFPRADVSRELDNFVRAELITDQTDERSHRNTKLQDELAHVTSLPYFVITTPQGKPVGPATGFTKNIPFFLRFLRDGFAANAQIAGK